MVNLRPLNQPLFIYDHWTTHHLLRPQNHL